MLSDFSNGIPPPYLVSCSQKLTPKHNSPKTLSLDWKKKLYPKTVANVEVHKNGMS